MNVDVTPTPEEIVQAEEAYDPGRPVSVAVCGPVETREVPAVRAGYRTEQGVGTAVASRLLPFEPRRKRATIIPVTQDVWISGSQAGAMTGASGAMRIPVNVPWTITHLDEVWSCSTSGTTDIGIQAEYWSE